MQENSPSAPPTDGSDRPRFRMLDCARGIALLLMLVSHAVELLPGNVQSSDWVFINSILLVTKAATPLFVFVFGMTMAFVYYNHLVTPDGLAVVRRRMLHRALLVFLSFEFLVVVVETAAETSPFVVVERLLYVRPGNWIEVLNFYLAVLLIGPRLLLLWRRASIGVRLVTVPVLYGLGVFLATIPVPPYLFVLKNIIAGYETSNPQAPLDTFPLLQLSSFFLVGLSSGEYLFNQKHAIPWRGVCWFTGLVIAVALSTSYIVTGETIRSYFGNMALDRYRFPPRIPYVLFGLSSVLGVTLVCLWLVQKRNADGFVVRSLELLGRHSLFTFNVQYVIMFTIYGRVLHMLNRQDVSSTMLNTLIIVVGCIAMVWVWERWRLRLLRR